jgi:hypothetical protein
LHREQRDFAVASKASLCSIKRLESAPRPLDTSGRTVDAIRGAFEERGVTFRDGDHAGVTATPLVSLEKN